MLFKLKQHRIQLLNSEVVWREIKMFLKEVAGKHSWFSSESHYFTFAMLPPWCNPDSTSRWVQVVLLKHRRKKRKQCSLFISQFELCLQVLCKHHSLVSIYSFKSCFPVIPLVRQIKTLRFPKRNRHTCLLCVGHRAMWQVPTCHRHRPCPTYPGGFCFTATQSVCLTCTCVVTVCPVSFTVSNGLRLV